MPGSRANGIGLGLAAAIGAVAASTPAWAQTSTMFGQIQTLLLTEISTAITTPMGNILSYVGGAFLAFATVAITIYGLAIMTGSTALVGFLGLRQIIRIAVIGLVLGSGGRYQEWVVQPWLVGAGGIPDTIVAAMGGQPGVTMIDRMWSQVVTLITALYDTMSAWDPGRSVFAAFAIVVVLVVGIVCCAIVFVQIVLAQVGMALVLMVGPLFVLCFMFDVTARWGWAWAGEVVHYGINYVLLAAAGLLVQGLVTAAVTRMSAAPTATAFALLSPMAFIVIALIITVFVFLQAGKVARAVSGGSASDALKTAVSAATGGRL